MATSIETVISALHAFEPVDYDVENIGALYEIFQDFQLIPDREQAVPAMLGLLERFPDAELGSPGLKNSSKITDSIEQCQSRRTKRPSVALLRSPNWSVHEDSACSHHGNKLY
jgi:hypothetical protein